MSWWRRALIPAMAIGMLAGALVIRQRTDAAFTASRSNTGNAFTAGNVTFGPNNPATALFTATNVFPGSTGSACVTLTYTGNLAGTVKMYAAVGGTGLAPYLNWRVSSGYATTSCTGAGTMVFGSASLNTTATTLGNFGTAYGSGSDSWAVNPAVASTLTKTYLIEWRMQDNNNAVSLTTTATLYWEAQTPP